MNYRKLIFPLALLFALTLSACGGDSAPNSSEVLTQAAQIAIDGLTQTAAVAPPTAIYTPEPTATDTPLPTATFTNTPEGGVPTATNTQVSASDGRPCWRGNLEYETIPDGTQYPVGRVFTKTWRIKNTGNCTWDSNTVAIFVEGELMGAKSVNEFTTVDIPTNDYAEITLSFQMPDKPGSYRSYWMLRSSSAIFGIGPEGLSWFWVDVTAFVPDP